VETAQSKVGSTTTTHVEGFEAGATETYPLVELKISIERDLAILEKVMDAILHVHHYEEPVIFVREDWASRANYNVASDNPNRWWNNGRGLPDKVGLRWVRDADRHDRISIRKRHLIGRTFVHVFRKVFAEQNGTLRRRNHLFLISRRRRSGCARQVPGNRVPCSVASCRRQ